MLHHMWAMNEYRLEEDSAVTRTVEAVRADIASAVSTVSAAESAFAAGEFATAGTLHLQAEQHMTGVLREICNLTDSDAVSVEPPFTRFEERLTALRFALLQRSNL